MDNKMMCGCFHHKIVPLCIILIGLLFFAAQMSWLPMMVASTMWPVLLIIIGLTKWMGPKCKCEMGHMGKM